ncbi:MAG: cobalamin biosynthesis protein CobD [Deltaproteobacteria bacterium]|nr:cobalamin biosynthesis protein CobD [Deltaproteobacteria bacterium]
MFNPIAPVPFPPAVLILAFVFDLIAGDPERLPHPVQVIGRGISLFERIIRRFAKTPSSERTGGIILALLIAGLAYGITLTLLALAYRYSTPVFFALSTYIVWTSISIKSLRKEAQKVVESLKDKGLGGARKQLSRIVGRDTQNLSQQDILKATVETVSENTSDGIIAPLFYLAIGGPALMMAYKAVNTLDSMVGYKDERYLNFGRAAARLDDAANYIPSRLTGALMVTASFILGYNWKSSLKILVRDGRNHPSPNSGMPEAAAAGALGIRLGGGATYKGVFNPKPFIGDNIHEPDIPAVNSSIRIMRLSAFMMVLLALAARIAAVFVL